MLRRLSIHNLAVVEEVEVEFGPSLNVLTGSTGAGKSLIMGAVNLLLGDKGSTDSIRKGCDGARVEAEFTGLTTERHLGLGSISARGGRIVVSRELSRGGRSHATIDGRAVPLRELRAVVGELIEPHGQNEQHRLRDPASHIDYIDAYARHEPLLERYRAALEVLRAAEAELARFDREMATLREREELLAHRLEEIERVSPKPGEKASLETTARVLANAERIFTAMTAACAALHDDDASAVSLVGRVRRNLGPMAPVDDRIARIDVRLGEVETVLADCVSDARALLEALDFESAEVDRLQERLDLLSRLERRHGMPIETLLERAREWKRDLEGLASGGDRRGELEAAAGKAAHETAEAAEALSRSRQRAARDLDRRVTEDLGELMMPGAHFRTELARAPDATSRVLVGGQAVTTNDDGIDVVRMRVRTNLGEEEGALEGIASTGELSRVALVLKELTASPSSGATLIFDELDTGVGADLGSVIAEKLLALAVRHQIICVTHMSQIAARGHTHLVVVKKAEKDRTRVRVRPVEGEDRTREIARMLGGEHGSDRRLALAAELLHSLPSRTRPRARVRP